MLRTLPTARRTALGTAAALLLSASAAAAQDGQSLVRVLDRGVPAGTTVIDGFVVPSDLPEDRLNRVKHFLRFATSSQKLADISKYQPLGPARASSQPLVGKHAELGIEMAQHMATNPENAKTGILFNYAWWADHRDELDARFQSWLGQ